MQKMKNMRVLVACEESQEVCKAFRKLGHRAFSCDIQECSGGHPEWHIKKDIFHVLCSGNHGRWDLIIAHPPCTYLCNSGVRWLYNKDGSKNIDRWDKMKMGALFFKSLLHSNADYVAVENPIMHKYAKEIVGENQTQIIQPWQFGHGETKATCLWLKGLPKLKPTSIVDGRENRIHKLPPSKDRAKLRSKTYPGIAKAMAEQWGNLPCTNEETENDRVENWDIDLCNKCHQMTNHDSDGECLKCSHKNKQPKSI